MTAQTNWRDQAINEALGPGSYDGLEVLLREVRRNQPGSATLTLWPDRKQLLRFLNEHATGLRSLLIGSSSHEEKDELWPYLGWYAAEWQGQPIEVVLSPTYSTTGATVCIAADQPLLQRFARALNSFVIRPAGRCLAYAQGWDSAPELDAEVGKVTWEHLVLPAQVLSGLRDAIEGFFEHRQAFAALGFSWRRGILLIGPPGTGKTMVCKAAAAALPELPFLYVRDFQRDMEQDRDVIEMIFERARKLAPCILAFEDIDGLVNEANRTVFLNELDGFHNNEGLLIIASSNHPGKIDEALLKRPSRFDRVFHLGLPGRVERREYCLRVLQGSALAERLDAGLNLEELALRVAERSDGFTPAYLKEVFTSAALERAQAGALVLDQQFADAVLAQVRQLRDFLRNMRDPELLAELNGRGTERPLGFRP